MKNAKSVVKKDGSQVKINLGCGNEKWKGFINIDCDPNMKPDLVLDIRHEKFPYEKETIEEIWMCHTI